VYCYSYPHLCGCRLLLINAAELRPFCAFIALIVVLALLLPLLLPLPLQLPLLLPLAVVVTVAVRRLCFLLPQFCIRFLFAGSAQRQR